MTWMPMVYMMGLQACSSPELSESNQHGGCSSCAGFPACSGSLPLINGAMLCCAVQTMMNAHGIGEVALAGSSSNLFATIADAYRRAKAIQAGDEIIIAETAHEVGF